jgi:hypothetical protein
MRFTLTIDCDNAAFGSVPNPEIARILREMAVLLHGGHVKPGDHCGMADANGNKVGSFGMTETVNA